MATEVQSLPFDAEEVTRFSEKRNEPKWFTDKRIQALRLAEELSLPKPEKTRIDSWNFTDFNNDTAGTPVHDFDKLPEDAGRLIGAEEKAGNVLVHHNSTPVFHTFSQELEDQGVIFTDLATAVREHGDLVQKYYFKTTRMDKHKLTALNAALVNGGTFLYIPRNVIIEDPIQTVYYQDAPSSGLIAHTIIVAEAGSSVTYVESYLSGISAGEGVANLVSEVRVGENAQVKYGAVDNFTEKVVTYVNRTGSVARDGSLQWALGQMNDGNTLSENATDLLGDGSSADTKAVSIGSGVQKQNFDNYVRHVGKGTISRVLVRGALKDASNCIFNARTKIEHGASKADGEQTQRVLMLSDKARGDANPILLIDEYDVIAGHAASVGRVDQNQLYYLMSRGIRKETAEKLIVEGFLEPVVELLPVVGVRKQLSGLIERKVG
jgi:FeS assembly protein SufD